MKTTYLILSMSLFLSLLGFSQTNTNPNSLSAPEFKKIIDTKQVTLIDVRTESEFSAGHIPGAINIDVSNPDFTTLVKKQIKKDKPIAVYCRSGHRSKIAVSKLGNIPNEIYELNHGFMSWQQAGFAVKK